MKRILEASLLALLLLAPGPAGAADAPKAPATGTSEVSTAPNVVVHYLHGTARCANCFNIEKWSKAALETGFPAEMKSGRLEWRMFNTDEDAHAHFVEDFQLYTKAIVLGEVKDGKVARWKNLEKIWDLLRDEAAFKAYIAGETRAFLDGK